MEDDTPPRVLCPECGSKEILVNRRYGIDQTIKVLARRFARIPYFWVGVVCVGVGVFYTAFQWRGALVFLGIMLIITALISDRSRVRDAGGVMWVTAARCTCGQCGHEWNSDKPWALPDAPGLLAISFIVGSVLAWLSGIVVQSLLLGRLVTGEVADTSGVFGYSVFCFPILALIIGVGGAIGAGYSSQGRRVSGAIFGVWLGVVLAVVLGAVIGMMKPWSSMWEDL